MDSKAFIKQYHKQIPDSFCDEMINIFELNDKENKTYSGKIGQGINQPNLELQKSSMDLDLEGSPVTLGINDDMKFYTKLFSFCRPSVVDYYTNCIATPNNLGIIPSEQKDNYIDGVCTILQPPRIKRYKKNKDGYHTWHYDWMAASPNAAGRTMVLMFYLNDVEEGGETEFLHQNLKIKPEKGKVVIFPAYFTHIHKGNIPISNDKYICNIYMGVNGLLKNGGPGMRIFTFGK